MNEVKFSRQVKEVKFGEWVLDPKRQCICDGDTTRELEPLLFRLLCYLIINNEQIITRQDLVDDVWSQNYVDDNAINRAMSELRKILKSDKQRGIVVKTHYRKGYSFFLEPEIIYYSDIPAQAHPDAHSSSVSPSISPVSQIDPSCDSEKPPNRFTWVFKGAALCCVIGLTVAAGVKFGVNEQEVITPSIVTQDQPIKEHALSWMQGRYTLLNLSPNDAMVAYSFIKRDTNYYSLVVKNLKSGHERRLGEQGVNYYPVGWSLDSNTIYYRIVDGDKCQVWQLNADFNSGSEYLFDCKINSMTGGEINQGRLVYAKSGYRNRDELSALTNRDLATGEEFQITSPNLNSYGDRFLTYIPEKEIILFERRQYDTNELYMTDPDGGNQVKIYDSASRIWGLSYDEKTEQLVWFNNAENVVYGFSLNEMRLVKAQKLLTDQSYANYEILNSRDLLMTSYPFVLDIYRLNTQNDALEPLINSKREDSKAVEVPEGFLFLTRLGDVQQIHQMNRDGKVKLLGLPNAKYKALRYNQTTNELLVQYARKIEVYNLSDLSLTMSKSVDGTLVSVEYLNDEEISYTVIDEQKVNSSAYVWSSVDGHVRKLPMQSTLWLDRLNEDTLITLSSNDIISAFDLHSGEVIHRVELLPAKYKHSVAILDGTIYHSNGKRIFKIDFSSDVPIETIHTVNDPKLFIEQIRGSKSGQLIADIIRTVDNQLLKVSMINSGNDLN
ncbi:winged helix-turn-helix domain-containing protein [Pseudoalteromonas luteoviolacea]|uniref:winged helix-turn-helix domain-containing protein n=1 Tax=Pseudoalteromonas luteoviolacea TaxID=43657 RepID=UPI001B39ECB0|nr:winged helix-turn-helix domain-containing protein [Pseudoalteromonas luteoviolacea]MBQ4879737.1 winged helix-turn-helix domain-containing protein [Pseudoalteromonas luteoviolacea]MBQ4908799.1 winged helix-turn-helix domain-containing protein [Pseudoalteromonas luteoviolacea]